MPKEKDNFDPDDGGLSVATYETNDDPNKRQRIINTLIKKITKDIGKKVMLMLVKFINGFNKKSINWIGIKI